jgi:hypothetical protein
MCGLATTPTIFTEQAVLTKYLKIAQSNEIESSASKDQTPNKTDFLKAENNWFKFSEKRLAAKMPLANLIIRDHEVVTDAHAWLTQRLICK